MTESRRQAAMFVFPEQCVAPADSERKERETEADGEKKKEKEGKKEEERQKKTRGENRRERRKIECKSNKHHEPCLSPVPHRESGVTFHGRERRRIPNARKKRKSKNEEGIYDYNRSCVERG